MYKLEAFVHVAICSLRCTVCICAKSTFVCAVCYKHYAESFRLGCSVF